MSQEFEIVYIPVKRQCPSLSRPIADIHDKTAKKGRHYEISNTQSKSSGRLRDDVRFDNRPPSKENVKGNTSVNVVTPTDRQKDM